MTDLEVNPPELDCQGAHTRPGPELIRLPARRVPLGGVRAAVVDRILPHRDLPTVGAWCFLDSFTPGDVPMNVLPHPHIGLQTVTWPLAGEILHRDSLGSHQVVRAGELNLMTAGDGVSHSEWTVSPQPVTGLQLWVALPDSARTAPASFEHIADLPVLSYPGARVTVLVGEHDGAASPAQIFSPLVGLEIALDPSDRGTGLEIGLRPDFEYAALVTAGAADIAGQRVRRQDADLLYLGAGRSSLDLRADAGGARITLLGGEPFGEDLLMWWNFVARSHEEIASARMDWEDPHRRAERFGTVQGHDGALIPAPPLPNVRLVPRRRRLPPPPR